MPTPTDQLLTTLGPMDMAKRQAGAQLSEWLKGLMSYNPQWAQPPAPEPPTPTEGVEAVPFGALSDPVSQLAFLLAPGLRATGQRALTGLNATMTGRQGVPQPALENGTPASAPGAAVSTAELDRLRYGPAAPPLEPQIYARPSDLERRPQWPMPLLGDENISGTIVADPARELPAELYHVTTNYPAVRASGGLKHIEPGTTAGLGKSAGMGERGVSLTTQRATAEMIERELQRTATLAQAPDQFPAVLQRMALEDEQVLGLEPGALHHLQRAAADTYATTLEATQDPMHASWEAMHTYWKARGRTTALENPIIYGTLDRFQQVLPEDVRLLPVPSANIPAEALVRTNPYGTHLNEVMAHSDIPLKLLLALMAARGLLPQQPQPAPAPQGAP